jgi:choline kinase
MIAPKKAFVLAAGQGMRMRPLTDNCPKPLLEVGGCTMLDRTLDALAAAGVEEAVVNCWYLADQIEAIRAPAQRARGSARGADARHSSAYSARYRPRLRRTLFT